MNDFNEDASSEPHSVSDKLTLAGKSKELCNLVVELDEIISISGRYQNKFRHFMVYFCKKNNIEWLPQMGDSLQVLTASDLLFLVETKLPRHGWDDTKIAALLGNVANKTGLPDMHDKFLDLRQELSRPKPDKGGNVDPEIDRAISFVCGQLGREWKLFFAQLGLQSSLLDDCDEEKSIPLKCYRAFDKWKTIKGKSATIDKLLRALCESERLGTAEELVDKLSLPGCGKVLESYRQQDGPLSSSTSLDDQSSYSTLSSSLSFEAKQMAIFEDPALPEDHIQQAEKCVPSENRHVQILAVGQTGMGKTRSMNRTFGTMATEAVAGQGSVTDKVTTYTRTLRIGGGAVPFRLSFTDTPGLGDSDARFSDNDICKAIKKSIRPDAAVFILYFIKNGESKNQRHIAAIEKLEKVTKRQITAVVITNAMKIPDYGECSKLPVAETFQNLHEELELAWTPRSKTSFGPKKGLLPECVEYLQMLEEDETVDEFDKQPNGDPWRRKTKKLVVQLYFRRKIHREFKNWFRKHLNRPNLSVIKIENDSVEYGDERGKFGLFQFHTNLGLLLKNETPYASRVFALMTLHKVQALTNNLELSVIGVGSQTSDAISILEIPAPEDDSSTATRIAREESSRGLLQLIWAYLSRFIGLVKKATYGKPMSSPAQHTKIPV
ncbi:uncharacterized protein [Oscarella lobularis]